MIALGKKRERLWNNQKGLCFYCGALCGHPCRGTVDHYIPRAHGGTNCNANLRFACRQCNLAKADRMPDDKRWQKTLRKLIAEQARKKMRDAALTVTEKP